MARQKTADVAAEADGTDGTEEASVSESHLVEQPKRRGPRAGTPAARRGGRAVLEKYGSEFFAKIGAKGGQSMREHHGHEYFVDIGQKGGKATREALGTAHYERIGRMGGLRTRKRDREEPGAPSDAKKARR